MEDLHTFGGQTCYEPLQWALRSDLRTDPPSGAHAIILAPNLESSYDELCIGAYGQLSQGSLQLRYSSLIQNKNFNDEGVKNACYW
jgi:hypothetical protein